MRVSHAIYALLISVTLCFFGGVAGYVLGTNRSGKNLVKASDLRANVSLSGELEFAMLMAEDLHDPSDQNVARARKLLAIELSRIIDEAASGESQPMVTKEDISKAKEMIEKLDD